MSGIADPSIRMDSEYYKKATSVEEMKETSAVLKAAARHMGQACAEVSLGYMRCKKANNGDPTKCLEQGEAVTKCGIEFFKALRSNCGAELDAQAECLESNNHTFSKCRKTQSALDECVFEKMNLDGAYKTYDTTRASSSYAQE
ncbi:hypothetical protein PTSG_00211 [Salpingoeca rosetta]|uniref:CHCH domain-containing protein n=1 Tax=Salpingoeca rosetta (strain ATCC 50818 / BSB-021) TaxID=946362 RepID=F2TVU3_SALR5|nr:uncharacterized protein PTSG_00211 [Salpingoeca rosetta]EGD72189.1 hypothetical protein PTSG_00211 [Salpingoeca rosetta]|eukprot:XP_004998760.1 hypothetical protein PTSG_00211 [Salpingoeca rosetta]